MVVNAAYLEPDTPERIVFDLAVFDLPQRWRADLLWDAGARDPHWVRTVLEAGMNTQLAYTYLQAGIPTSQIRRIPRSMIDDQNRAFVRPTDLHNDLRRLDQLDPTRR